jgi:cell division protease FtsH
VSPRTQELIDEEMRRIVGKAHEEVQVLLREHRSKLDGLADALLARETLDEDDAYAAANVPRSASGSADGYSAAARSRSSSLDDDRPEPR